jgi:hypothetical protein
MIMATIASPYLIPDLSLNQQPSSTHAAKGMEVSVQLYLEGLL